MANGDQETEYLDMDTNTLAEALLKYEALPPGTADRGLQEKAAQALERWEQEGDPQSEGGLAVVLLEVADSGGPGAGEAENALRKAGADVGPPSPEAQEAEAREIQAGKKPEPGGLEESQMDYIRKEYQSGRMSAEEEKEAMAPFLEKYGTDIIPGILDREEARIDAEVYPSGKGSGRCPKGTHADPKTGQCKPIN